MLIQSFETTRKTTYAKLRTRSGLKKVARHPDVVSFRNDTMIPLTKKGCAPPPR